MTDRKDHKGDVQMKLTIDELGEILEQSGMSDDEIDAYFAHYGVQGMKWGVRRAKRAESRRELKGPDRFGNRNTKSFQRRQDRMKAVANGTAAFKTKLRAGLFDIPVANIMFEGGLSGGAHRTLEQNQRVKNKITDGRKRVTDKLLRLQGIDVRDLDFSVE